LKYGIRRHARQRSLNVVRLMVSVASRSPTATTSGLDLTMDAAAARSHAINQVRSVGILATRANVQEGYCSHQPLPGAAPAPSGGAKIRPARHERVWALTQTRWP